jgi:hypothetical protein
MSRRGGRDELVREEATARARQQTGELSYSSGSEGSQHPPISPEMDPYVAFRMGLVVGRALAAQEQALASTAGERTTEGKPEAEQDLVPHLHGGTDQSLPGSTSPTGSEEAKRGHFKHRRSSTDQPTARKSRSPKKAQVVPDLDPRLKFHLAMNLMGEKTAREYLVWLFTNEETEQ